MLIPSIRFSGHQAEMPVRPILGPEVIIPREIIPKPLLGLLRLQSGSTRMRHRGCVNALIGASRRTHTTNLYDLRKPGGTRYVKEYREGEECLVQARLKPLRAFRADQRPAPDESRKRGLSDFTGRFHAINITFSPFHL